MVKGYCMKERKKNVDILNPQYELNANNSPIVRGNCSSCGGKVYKILASDEIPADLKAKALKAKASKAKKGAGSRRSRKSQNPGRKSRGRKSTGRKSRK